MSAWRPLLLVPVAIVAPQCASAAVYLSVEQAQQALFPGVAFKAALVQLTEDQKAAIEKRLGARLRVTVLKLWRAPDGAVVVVDEVIGKHDFITYAVGIRADGAVKGIEILEYRESYGYEVRHPGWRGQFVGKTVASTLELDKDIRNIGGATMSCRHITEGVRRLLITHELALR